jgi:hypothetical protein
MKALAKLSGFAKGRAGRRAPLGLCLSASL